MAEFFLNKPSGLLGNAARVPAQEASEAQTLAFGETTALLHLLPV